MRLEKTGRTSVRGGVAPSPERKATATARGSRSNRYEEAIDKVRSVPSRAVKTARDAEGCASTRRSGGSPAVVRLRAAPPVAAKGSFEQQGVRIALDLLALATGEDPPRRLEITGSPAELRATAEAVSRLVPLIDDPLAKAHARQIEKHLKTLAFLLEAKAGFGDAAPAMIDSDREHELEQIEKKGAKLTTYLDESGARPDAALVDLAALVRDGSAIDPDRLDDARATPAKCLDTVRELLGDKRKKSDTDSPSAVRALAERVLELESRIPDGPMKQTLETRALIQQLRGHLSTLANDLEVAAARGARTPAAVRHRIDEETQSIREGCARLARVLEPA